MQGTDGVWSSTSVQLRALCSELHSGVKSLRPQEACARRACVPSWSIARGPPPPGARGDTRQVLQLVASGPKGPVLSRRPAHVHHPGSRGRSCRLTNNILACERACLSGWLVAQEQSQVAPSRRCRTSRRSLQGHSTQGLSRDPRSSSSSKGRCTPMCEQGPRPSHIPGSGRETARRLSHAF